MTGATAESQGPEKPHIIGGATSRTMRAHWAATELNLDYSYELIGSRTGATTTPEFLALNPKHKIPVLLHKNLVLTESAAIMNYLGRLARFDADPLYSGAMHCLLPSDTLSWAAYEEWQSFILMELDAQCLYVMRKHRDLPAVYGDAPGAVSAARDGFNAQIRIAETQLAHRTWLLGEQFSGVDILLTTCLEWALSYKFDLHPRLREYLKLVRARPAYQKARDLNFSISAGA